MHHFQWLVKIYGLNLVGAQILHFTNFSTTHKVVQVGHG